MYSHCHYSEFIDFRKHSGLSGGDDLDAELQAYIRRGGFPALSVNDYGDTEARKIVEDINSTALIRDVIRGGMESAARNCSKKLSHLCTTTSAI